MYQHPFARALSPGVAGDYIGNSERTERRLWEAYPSSSRLPSSSHPFATRSEIIEKVSNQQVQPCGLHRMVIQDAGVTLTLNGQEEGATVPVYGKGATVDGTLSLANPSSITKVEVKMEGHVTVQESGGDGSSDTPVLSELLVFWDAPNRLGGYGNGAASGDFSPLPGSCPRSFSFRTTLPTQYIEADGSTCALPPSFTEALHDMPGFHCAVRYAIIVCVTRVRDVKVKSLRAQWKRNTAFRTAVEYRPRTRPSHSAPFPANSNPTSGPVTRFNATIDSTSPHVQPIKTMLYLPNSQVTSLSSPIPFFLRVSGSEAMINAYSRPPLSSFLPKASPEGFPTICEMIGQFVHENLQNSKLVRALSFPGSPAGGSSWSALSSHDGSEKGYDGWEVSASGSKKRSRVSQPSTGVRVLLVRQVSVSIRSHPGYSHGYDDFFDSGRDTSSEDFLVDGVTDNHIHKDTILGEGMMYTARVARESITWAGEIRIDPALGICTGGFRAGDLLVRDMLVVSVKGPYPDPSSGQQKEYQQVIPVHLTTDPFKQE